MFKLKLNGCIMSNMGYKILSVQYFVMFKTLYATILKNFHLFTSFNFTDIMFYKFIQVCQVCGQCNLRSKQNQMCST